MKVKSVNVAVYERIRRYGTQGKTRGSGHAKAVTKAVAQLELGSSVFNTNKTPPGSKDSSSSTKKIIEKELPSDEAVRYLDAFEKKTDNLAVQQKMKRYTDYKKKLLDSYGVENSSFLTEAAKVHFKKDLAKQSFRYYEYQVVLSWTEPDGSKKSVHSHRMKVVSKKPVNHWGFKEEDSSLEENLDFD